MSIHGIKYTLINLIIVYIRVKTGSGHLGYLGQPADVLTRSSKSDPVYKISGSDPDSALNHMC